MVTIQRRLADDGYYFEIDDYAAYAKALDDRGIEPPKAGYRLFLSFENERRLRETMPDWQRQIELFYRLGSSTNIPSQIVAS